MPIRLSELIDTNDTARVLIWFKDNLLLLKSKKKGWWTIPGGHIKKREEPEEAAAREVEEETGISLTPTLLKLVEKLDNDEGGQLYLYEIMTNHKFGSVRVNHEFNDFKWIPLDDLPEIEMDPIQQKYIIDNYFQ